MLKRLRSTGLAGGGAMLLVLSLSGVVAAATILTAVAAPVVDPTVPAVVADTTNTFEDVDGNGVDDDCQTDVVANPEAAAAAEAAADLNGDGQVSVSEAAQSGRTGGTNCNHGGYVSIVAHADETCDGTEPADTTEPADEGDTTEPADEADTGDADAKTRDEADTGATTTTATTTCTDTSDTTDTTVPVVCTPPVVTTTTDATTTDATTTDATTTEPTVDAAPNAHGKAVSKVAHSTDIGGKNCNHGGAVSAAAHDNAARDAAKAARDAARALKHANHKHGKHHNG